MGIASTAAAVYRDHVTVGVPGSGLHQPVPLEIRELFSDVEDEFTARPRGYASIAAAQADSIAAGIKEISVYGEFGGLYENVATDPSDPGGSFQSSDGKWWLLKRQGIVSLKSFGAKGDNATDDTIAINNWLTFISKYRQRGLVPDGTYLHGTITIPSNVEVYGISRDRSIFKMKNAHNTTGWLNSGWLSPLAIGGGNSNIIFSDVAFDGNVQNQTVNSYTFALANVANVIFQRNSVYNIYGNGFYLFEPEYVGLGGTGGPPPAPAGQQFNFNVKIFDNRFDATSQVVSSSDAFDFLKTDGLYIERNHFIGGGANLLALEFNINTSIRNNKVQRFVRGIYAETCKSTSIEDNDIYESAQTSAFDVPFVGIWAVDADQTYIGGGYQGCASMSIAGNRIFDVAKPINVFSVTVASGGGGYSINDTITINGGSFSAPAVLRVTAVSGGAVTAAAVITKGVYSIAPADPAGQLNTSGVGSGATFNTSISTQGIDGILVSGPLGSGLAAFDIHVNDNQIERLTSSVGTTRYIRMEGQCANITVALNTMLGTNTGTTRGIVIGGAYDGANACSNTLIIGNRIGGMEYGIVVSSDSHPDTKIMANDLGGNIVAPLLYSSGGENCVRLVVSNDNFAGGTQIKGQRAYYPVYTVAQLATDLAGASAGHTVFCSNARVFNGAGTQETATNGTGSLVVYNGTAWKIVGTNVTATA